MSGRNGGFGDYNLSGLPRHLRPGGSSGYPSGRRDGYEPSGMHPSEMRRHESSSSRRRGPPVSYYNNDRGYGGRFGDGGMFRPDEYARNEDRRDEYHFQRRGALASDRDPYDPYAGMRRRSSGVDPRRHPSVYGDSELPPYRSASTYAREQRPPSYGSSQMAGGYGFSERAPPYSSFSSQGGYGGPAPMQYPPTRRSSAYRHEPSRPSAYDYPSSGRRPEEMDPRYFMYKHDRR